MQKIIKVHSNLKNRTRDTNFKKNYHSSILTVYNKDFRDELENLGLPYGKKDKKIKPPKVEYCEKDYIRGLIDGDGSLGYTSNDFPFVSFTTSSKYIAKYYINYLNKLLDKNKTTSRNKRDNIFNIAIYKEDAQKLVEKLYYKDCLCLNRRLTSARKILEWERPENMRKVLKRKEWNKEQDEFILNHSIEKSIEVLNRTESSIRTRLWRLNKE